MKNTTYVRKLSVGDVFTDDEGNWEVTVPPQLASDGDDLAVAIGVTARNSKRKYTRTYLYEVDARVRLAA